MNSHDSLRMEQLLRERGYGAASAPDHADLIVFNTCSIRAKAEQKLFSAVGTFRDLKNERPDLIIAVAGCMAQQYGKVLFNRQPIVDLAIGPDHIEELPDLVERIIQGEGPLVSTGKETGTPRFMPASATTGPRVATCYVTIMKGCNERCSYCIVPSTRGRERYRPSREIITEVSQLATAGVSEITLLGQTVNAWREPNAPGEPAFDRLVRAIASEAPTLRRLRYTSPHPRYMTPSLIEAYADLAILPAHVHLPVQSGSDRILKRMVRRHNRSQYLDAIGALKRARPGLTVSTDLIVGFPGETAEDFQRTLDLVREAQFVAAYGFKYSPRPLTPALQLSDDVPEAVKEERLAILLGLIEEQQNAHLASLVGQSTWVLLEGTNEKQPTLYTGRSERNEIVHVSVPFDADWSGAMVRVMIEQANKHSLMASLIDGPSHRPRCGSVTLSNSCL
jgi:tRNA-2-methylthio-N6-dimethylallyladenosine synthase